MQLIQILIIVFALFALSRVFLRFRDNKLTKNEFLFWTLVWLAVVVFAFMPQVTSIVSSILGIGRGVDLVIYLSIIVLFYLMFRLYVKVDSIRKDITQLVRKFAIEDEDAKKKQLQKKQKK
jgi:small membrane protein